MNLSDPLWLTFILSVIVNLIVLGTIYGIIKTRLESQNDRIKDLENQKGPEISVLVKQNILRIDRLDEIAEKQNEINLQLNTTLSKLEGWVEGQKS